ncbi:MAG TPA: 50S ribosomal protein L24 [Ruminococcaceae bacterium]|nr:50S ribosomal protein L24 [Oscillospiraceae bacterium]
MMSKVHVKTGDTVVLLTGKDSDKYIDASDKSKGRKTGKVLEVSNKENKVIVEGINFVTKHVKPRMMGQSGSIVQAEAPVFASKVQLVCPKCGKPTRVGHEMDGKNSLRICKKCGEKF